MKGGSRKRKVLKQEVDQFDKLLIVANLWEKRAVTHVIWGGAQGDVRKNNPKKESDCFRGMGRQYKTGGGVSKRKRLSLEIRKKIRGSTLAHKKLTKRAEHTREPLWGIGLPRCKTEGKGEARKGGSQTEIWKLQLEWSPSQKRRRRFFCIFLDSGSLSPPK